LPAEARASALVCPGAGEAAALAAMVERLADPLPQRIRCLPAGVAIASPVFEATAAAVVRAVRGEALARRTRAAHGATWARQLTENLEALEQLPATSSLDGCLAGCPAILASAGPSLDDAMQTLLRLDGRALLIANNRSAGALAARGITPDVVVVSDAVTPRAHLGGLRTEELSLLALEVAAPPELLALPGPRAVFVGNRVYVDWLEALAGVRLRLENGGSVATCAFSLAVRLGCDPLILVGHDLAVGARPYADGAGQAGAERVGALLAPGYHGGTVLTSLDLEEHRRWFEERACALGHRRRLFNCSEGGARIDGFHQAPLASILAGLDRPAPFRAALAEGLAAGRAARRPGLSRLRARLTGGEAQDLATLERAAREVLAERDREAQGALAAHGQGAGARGGGREEQAPTTTSAARQQKMHAQSPIDWFRLFIPTALGNSVVDHVAIAKHKLRTGRRIGLAFDPSIAFHQDLIACNPHLDEAAPLATLPAGTRLLDATFGRPWNYLIENTERARLRVPEAHAASLAPVLAAHGIGPDDGVLALHVREPGYVFCPATHEPERFVAVEPFVELARRYLARGFKVIRIGDAAGTPFPTLPGLFDAAHRPGQRLLDDLCLIHRATVLVATDSGVWPIGVALGTPTVLSNSCHGQPALGAQRHWFPWEPGHLVLNKTLLLRGRELSAEEGVQLFRGTRWHAIPGQTELRDNTTDELEAAVESLLRGREDAASGATGAAGEEAA